jgi:hypothetical protein
MYEQFTRIPTFPTIRENTGLLPNNAPVISLREFHALTESKSRFIPWANVRTHGMKLGEDFTEVMINMPGVGRPRTEIFVSLDAFLNWAMGSRSAFGHKVARVIIGRVSAHQAQRGLSPLEGLKEVLEMATGKPVTFVDAQTGQPL